MANYLFRSKNSPKNFARISFLLFSILLSTAARSDVCHIELDGGGRADRLDWTFPSFKVAEFDPNVPVGTTLYRSRSKANGRGGVVVCPLKIGTSVYYVATSISSGGWNTYKTGIEGIGIRIKGGINQNWWPQQIEYADNVTRVTMLPADDFTVELVKIGKITAGGRITGAIGEVMFVNFGYVVRRISLEGEGIVVEPRVPSCALETKPSVLNWTAMQVS